MGTMDKRQADRLLGAARGLGARDAYVRGGRVHVHLTAYTSAHSQLGDLHVEVSKDSSVIRDYWHSPSPQGVLWSREVARAVTQLDTMRQLPC